MKDFDKFLNTMIDTINYLSFFVDWDKIKENIATIEIKLNILNYLIGKDDLKNAINEIYKENKDAFEILPILIALRPNTKRKVINNKNEIISIKNYLSSPDLIYQFLVESGLSDIFVHKEIKNLVDYVFGIETGLDTHSRKNRSGKIMARIISNKFDDNNIKYLEEVSSKHIDELENLGVDIKRFDFLVKTKKKMYLIEVNYYSGGGSKLSETARSYIEIAEKVNKNRNLEFVWITDGKGWETAKDPLKEAYNRIDKMYNLKTLEEFIELIKREGQNE